MLRVAVVLIVLGTLAYADTPPTFAIDLRSKDALADKVTKTLEEALRDRGSTRRADYRAKGTRKDRVAASTDDCPSALTTTCATSIGARLGVDYMFAGWVETRGKRFVLSLDIVNVRTRARVRSLRDLAASTVDAKTWSKIVYGRIVDDTTGDLVISCNVPRATVLVDGQPVTDLHQGRATIAGLAMGMHAIEVRAAGFKPYFDEVRIDGTTKLSVLLDRVE